MKILLAGILVLMTLLNCGCQFVAKTMYGFKEPDFESPEAIKSRQREWFGKERTSAVLKFENWKNNRLYSSPELFVFDSNGRYIPYKDPQRPNCNGPAEQFISELDKAKVYHFNDSLTLNDFIADLDKPACGGEFELPQADVDFYIFITWATFAGKKLNTEKINPWLKEYDENQKIKGELFLLNMDLQQCWSEDQKGFFIKK